MIIQRQGQDLIPYPVVPAGTSSCLSENSGRSETWEVVTLRQEIVKEEQYFFVVDFKIYFSSFNIKSLLCARHCMCETLLPSLRLEGGNVFRGHKERTNSTGIVLCSWILAPFQENFPNLKSSPNLAGVDRVTQGNQAELRLSLAKETAEADGGDGADSVWAVSEEDCFSLFSSPSGYFTRNAPTSPWSIRASSVGSGRISPALAMSSLKKLEQQN